jgi:iron complex outermembrane receptor protein
MTTGMQILNTGEQFFNLTAQPVIGTYSLEQALQLLLAGTGLTYRYTEANTVALERVTTPTLPSTQRAQTPSADPPAQRSQTSPAKPQPEDAPTGSGIVLPDVTVQGMRPRASAWRPVRGYVATRSATGTKTDTPLLETPQAISVVTSDQMAAQGATSVPQALRYTSGIIAEQRGVNTAGLEYLFGRGFQLEQYLDGLKLPPVTLRFTVPSFDAYALERVELLHGPASVLYGQGFPGGIVNLISKRPTVEPLHEIQLQTGSYSRLQGAFDLGGRLDQDGHFFYRLTGLARDTETQIDHDQQQRFYIAPALTWQPGHDTALTILGNYKRDPRAGFYNGLPPEAVFNNPNGTLSPNFNPGDPDFDRHDQDGYSLGYILDHRFNDIWSVRQNLRYTRTDDFIRRLFSDTLKEDGRTLTRFVVFHDESVKVFTIDNQAQAKFRTGAVQHTAMLGLDYQRLDYRDTGAFDFSPTVPSIDIFHPVYRQFPPVRSPTIRERFATDQLGLYVQDQVKFRQWSVLAGVRHGWAWSKDKDLLDDTVEKQSDRAFTWRVGLTYLFDAIGLAPYGSVATSFRPTAGTDFAGNTFEPTTGRQYELGVKYQPRDFNFFVTAAIFHLEQNNVTTPDPEHPTFSIQTGQVRSRGIELEGHASLTSNLDLVAAYTYLDQIVTKSNGVDLDKRLPGMPTHTASLWLDYTWRGGLWHGLGFGVGVRYVGPSAGDRKNTVDVPEYTLVDAAMHYDLSSLLPALKGGRLAVNVSNLFDKHYIASCIGSFCEFGLERNIVATLSYRW